MIKDILVASYETILMSSVSVLVAYAFGLPLAVIEDITAKGGLAERKLLNRLIRIIIGIGRSIPFPVLAVLILPFTRWLIGTGVGTIAVIVPLTVTAIPYVSSHISLSLKNVDRCITESARVFGAGTMRVELLKLGVQAYDIVDGAGVTSISVICYTTMAGLLGGGGLGNYALTNGLYRYNWNCVLFSTIAISIIVIITSSIFKYLSRKLCWEDKR